MADRKAHCLILCFLCLFTLQSHIFAQIDSTPRDLIHYGDLIDVDIVGSSEFDWRGVLNPEGYLGGLAFLDDPVYGLCRNEDEVAAEIAKGYSKLLRNPQVVVKILDRSGRPASFLYGAVKTPQRFLIKRQISLNELLILAGGITDKASGEIQIIRPPNLTCPQEDLAETRQRVVTERQESFVAVKKAGGSKLLNIKINDLLRGDEESNPLILEGDMVTVLEADPIYIIGGGVVNPRQINARSEMTVIRAIASAGGFSKNADEKNITVYRRDTGGTKVIDIDLDAIKSGQATDFVLQKYDVVEVSQRGGDRRKIPPVIRVDDGAVKNVFETPLRIIE